MPLSLYNPFGDFTFEENDCFLSGKTIVNIEYIPVFPEWIMKRYSLHDKTMVMLAENVVKYSEIKVPCSPEVVQKINSLENDIQKAFEAGYESVLQIPEIRLFQWMAKIMYGVLYNDIVHGISQTKGKEKSFRLSPLLTRKFANLHVMLQSLIVPMKFTNFIPWSITVVPVNYSQDVFNYKDETKNINFSLGMNGFGIVACLQDNGENKKHHRLLLDKIQGKILHPIQFEELWSKFLYSNYLLNSSGNYRYDTSGEVVDVDLVPLPEEKRTPLFGKWDDKTFSQVLANYWKPWGLTTKDIYSFPNSPISFLEDEYTNEFIDPATIRHQH